MTHAILLNHGGLIIRQDNEGGAAAGNKEDPANDREGQDVVVKLYQKEQFGEDTSENPKEGDAPGQRPEVQAGNCNSPTPHPDFFPG